MVCGVKRSWKWVEIIPHTRYADFLVHRVALSLARGHGGVGRRRRGKKEMPHTEDTETQRGIVHRVELSLERRTQRRGVVTGEKGEMLSETSEGREEMPHTEDTETQRGIVHRVELSLERRTQRRGVGTEREGVIGGVGW